MNEEAAIQDLVLRYHDRVYRFGQQVCRDGYDADDAVQNAFITLARRPDVQRSANTLSWLMTVVRNACIGLYRAALGRKPLSESPAALDVPDEKLSPEAALLRFELVSQVHDAIASLEPDARAVLVLRDLEGLTGEETAKRLNLELATMKTRLHRARLAVRAYVLQRRARIGEA